jgi:transcriptional regulator with XRE-family HTH domain
VGKHVTQADRDHVRDLHAKGLGRNEIARAVGVSAGTVTNIAKDLGLSFDRSESAVAVAARATDLKARRQVLQGRLIARAEALFDRLEAPTYKTLVKVAGGAEQVQELDFVPARDEKDLQYAIGGYLIVEERLDKAGGDSGEEGARSMLAGLFQDVQGAWETAKATRDAQRGAEGPEAGEGA